MHATLKQEKNTKATTAEARKKAPVSHLDFQRQVQTQEQKQKASGAFWEMSAIEALRINYLDREY
jgi:hypothetical protein